MTLSNQIQYKSLTQLVAESLREKILTGEMKSGERIQQKALEKEFNVSSSPIRTALLFLHGEGLVTFKLHEGVLVNDVKIEAS